MTRCPKCGLLGAEGVSRCDCGHDFLVPATSEELPKHSVLKGLWQGSLIAGGIVLVLLAGSFGRKFANSAISGKPETDFASALEAASREMNAQLPRVVDRDTRLDSTGVGPGRRITYVYTLLNIEYGSMRQVDLQQNFQKVRNYVCTTADMKSFVSNGVEVVYRYRSSGGSTIGDIVVRPSDCT